LIIRGIVLWKERTNHYLFITIKHVSTLHKNTYWAKKGIAEPYSRTGVAMENDLFLVTLLPELNRRREYLPLHERVQPQLLRYHRFLLRAQIEHRRPRQGHRFLYRHAGPL